MTFITKYKYVIEPVEYEYLFQLTKSVHSIECEFCKKMFIYDEKHVECPPSCEDCDKHMCESCHELLEKKWYEKYDNFYNFKEGKCLDCIDLYYKQYPDKWYTEKNI